MGLFSSDEPSERVKSLVEEAKHDSVTVDNLTKKSYLNDGPVIDHLDDGEQPHFIIQFSSMAQGVVIRDNTKPDAQPPDQGVKDLIEPTETYKMNVVITDQRCLTLLGNKTRDQDFAFEYSKINNVVLKQYSLYTYLNIYTHESIFSVRMCEEAGGFEDNFEIIKQARKYMLKNIDKQEEFKQGDETTGEGEPDKNTEAGVKESEIQIEASVCTVGGGSGENPEFVHKVGTSEEVESTGLLSSETNKTENYEHTNICDVYIKDSVITVSNENLNINYHNIINVELLKDTWIVSGKGGDPNLLKESTYLRIIVDESKKSDEEIEPKSIYLIGKNTGDVMLPVLMSDEWTMDRKITKQPDVDKPDFEAAKNYIKERSGNLIPNLYIPIDWIEYNGKLRIEGVNEGRTNISGSVSGSTRTKGESKGVQVGPFSKSKSKSEGSIEAKIGGEISDNTFESRISYFQVDENGIYVDSDPIIDLKYSEIDRVFERDQGMMIEIGETTYSLSGAGILFKNSRSAEEFRRENVSEIVSFIQKQVENSRPDDSTSESGGEQQSEQTPAEKIQDLKQLYDDGIISQEEFESKKEALLDEF